MAKTGPAKRLAWDKSGNDCQWGGGIRGLMFLGGGLLLASGWRGGMILAVAALALFLLQLIGVGKILLNRGD